MDAMVVGQWLVTAFTFFVAVDAALALIALVHNHKNIHKTSIRNVINEFAMVFFFVLLMYSVFIVYALPSSSPLFGPMVTSIEITGFAFVVFFRDWQPNLHWALPEVVGLFKGQQSQVAK